jgi:transcriptional regulator with XRE-family HTH domain
METIGQRIRKVRGDMSLRVFADEIGVSHAAVAQWESGDTKSLKNENLLQISRRYKKRMEWLIDGELPEDITMNLADHDQLIDLIESVLKKEGSSSDLSKRILKLIKK